MQIWLNPSSILREALRWQIPLVWSLNWIISPITSNGAKTRKRVPQSPSPSFAERISFSCHNPRFNKSYFVYLRSIHDSWHECMILISELGANLRYEIYFEMRSELRPTLVETHSPNAKWFDDCLNVIRLYQTLEQPAFAAFSLVSDIRSGNRDNCDNTERDQLEEKSSGVRSTLGSIFAVSKWQKILHSILP